MQQILRCSCGTCRMPWAKIYNGILLVDSEHRGKRHTNGIALDVLRQVMQTGIEHFDDKNAWAQPVTFTRRSALIAGVETDVLALLCIHPDCGLPWAYVTNEFVIVEAEHNRFKHPNRLHLNGVLMSVPVMVEALFLR